MIQGFDNYVRSGRTVLLATVSGRGTSEFQHSRRARNVTLLKAKIETFENCLFKESLRHLSECYLYKLVFSQNGR